MTEVLMARTWKNDPAEKTADVKLIADVKLTRPVNAFVDAVNRRDLDAAIDQLAADALHYGRVSNYRPDGVRLLFNVLLTVFPDLRLDVLEQRVDGQRVTSRIIATGTHTGSFLGKPATGKPVAWQSIDVAEIGKVDVAEMDKFHGADTSNWKILKRFWDLWSDPSLWRDIGFIPAVMC
jgi:predicted ester cyclase